MALVFLLASARLGRSSARRMRAALVRQRLLGLHFAGKRFARICLCRLPLALQ